MWLFFWTSLKDFEDAFLSRSMNEKVSFQLIIFGQHDVALSAGLLCIECTTRHEGTEDQPHDERFEPISIRSFHYRSRASFGML